MRAGLLRNRVTIEQATQTYNALNESTNTWATLMERWAAVSTPGGREFVAAKQMVAELTDVVEMRYIAGITAQMRVRIGLRLLDIRAVVDVANRHETTQLYCVEREYVPPPVIPPPADYLLHTFSGGVSSTTVGNANTGQAPIVLAGTWGVDASGYAKVAASGAGDSVVFDAGHSDGLLSCDMPAADLSGAYWRMYFRTTDVNNTLMMIALSATQWAIYKLAAAASTQLGVWTAVPPAAGQTAGVLLNGSSITALVGVTTLGTVTETFNVTATKMGMGSGGGLGAWRWDNLRMTA